MPVEMFLSNQRIEVIWVILLSIENNLVII